ncbi:MAG: hypothetical protein LBG11_04720 [Bifidobacteriaceae bacterium]|nr:hypothetical protein [Bifidobacteriaceae bacterium]
MDAEIARLDRMTQMLDTLANVGMLWWVSATALVAGMLAGVWLQRKQLAAAKRAGRAVYPCGIVFLLTISVFGVALTIEGMRFSAGFSEACRAARKTAPSLCDPNAGELALTDFAPWALGIGTSSFLIALFVWFFMAHSVLSKPKTADSSTSPEKSAS